MNYTEILDDYDDFLLMVENYALSTYGTTVQIVPSSVLTISEHDSLDAGVNDGDFLFLNITSSISIYLFGIKTNIQSHLTINVAIYANFAIDSVSTRLNIFRLSFDIQQPLIYANISFSSQTVGQKFESYLNGSYYYPADLTSNSFNITINNGIVLRSEL